MWKFKGNKQMVLKGRTIAYVSKKIGVTRQHLGNILNKKIGCSTLLAKSICDLIYEGTKIEEFFDKIK